MVENKKISLLSKIKRTEAYTFLFFEERGLKCYLRMSSSPPIEMAFRNFVYAKDEEDLSFLPKEPSPGFGTGSPSVSVNIEPYRADEEHVLQPAECKTRGGSSRPLVKRKLAYGSLNSHATCAKTSTSKDDVPFLIVSDDDKGLSNVPKLKDVTACHLKISAITPLAWKNHLDNHMDVELLDLHDGCYARQAFVDNVVNRRSRELLEVIEKLRGKCDEVNEVRQDIMEVVLKVVPYAAIELIYIDDLGSLVGKLVSSAIIYGRCKAFEQVAAMKEPFDLSKVKGYRPSYKKEHDQAGNDLATTTFPWLSKFVADPSAPVEVILSKKPPSLQRHAPSKTQAPVSSLQKPTSSFVLASNSMSPPADAFVVKP
ncbi:hypothetical protein Tco_0782767 [Tanacetum coccineum]